MSITKKSWLGRGVGVSLIILSLAVPLRDRETRDHGRNGIEVRILGHFCVDEKQGYYCGQSRAALWCLAGARSRLDLTITLGARDQHAVVEARLFFDEERARLKLALPGGDTADFAVPGGVVRRGPQGEVPGGRWVRVLDRRGRQRFIFATDALRTEAPNSVPSMRRLPAVGAVDSIAANCSLS
jgi:hypothetical protein